MCKSGIIESSNGSNGGGVMAKIKLADHNLTACYGKSSRAPSYQRHRKAAMSIISQPYQRRQ